MLSVASEVKKGASFPVWNSNFDGRFRDVDGSRIEIGMQDFSKGTVQVREDDGTVIELPMYSKDGEIFFIYNGTGVYMSDYMGNFSLDELKRRQREGTTWGGRRRAKGTA